METVRNYLNVCIQELAERGEYHDQTKLHEPELQYFEKYTSRLRGSTYGSEEYKECLRGMKPALDHHYKLNDHHPEHFENSFNDMNLFQLIELICDWKAAGMRHENGDIFESIEINHGRFKDADGDPIISDQLKAILINTAEWLEGQDVFHKAEES
jgi:hypothetical protein